MSTDRMLRLPWTNVYGLARTLAALGTAGTLIFSSAETLFRPVATLGDYPPCDGALSASAFCAAKHSYSGLTWIMYGCVAVLLIAASGWRPRLTALPHAYVNYSVFSGIAINDGGDQVALILSVLFVLPSLGDPRRWHWNEPPAFTGARGQRVWALLGLSSLVMLRLQMSVIYFQAAVAKLPHAEWADGTAMWYWAQDLNFGAAPWLSWLIDPIVATPVGVALMTWVPLVIELSLAVALLLPQRYRYWAMWLGFFFHLCIASVMGLWSFALAMAAGITVLCMPLGSHIRRGTEDGRQTEPAPAVEPAEAPQTDRAEQAQQKEQSDVSAPDKTAALP
ncbi:sporulation-delaying protein SdpB family protein [Streptomyces decoyicus]|uniref:sporulation-delaying protein SdpB family protein n=1 Tax=Streptomyces decoyicus TaxID=249567 RepID=UPI0037FB1BA8